MPYVTQERQLTPAIDTFSLPPDNPTNCWVSVGYYEIRNRSTNALLSTHQLVGGTAGSEFTLGKQTTTSWRTGKSLDGLVDANRQLSGKELRDLILRGQDTSDGTLGSAFERGRFTNRHDSGHNFSSITTDLRSRFGFDKAGWIRIEGLERAVSATLKHVLYYYGPGPSRGTIPVPDASIAKSVRNANGTQWMARLAPTRPHFNLSRAILELFKDGLPALALRNIINSGGNIGKGLGGEYLNLQFGVIPLVKDVRNFLEAINSLGPQIEQLKRDSGRMVRRKAWNEPEVVDSWTSQTGSWNFSVKALTGPSPYSMSGFINTSSASTQRLTRSITNKGFAGAFSYFFPDDSQDDLVGRILNKMRINEILLGTTTDASDVYAVVPYSWLVDWFADLGSLLEINDLLASNGLVMPYGYGMINQTITNTVFVSGLRTHLGAPLPSYFYETSASSKYRDRGTPYGFALDPGSFSDYQWSILIALGLARGRSIRVNE